MARNAVVQRNYDLTPNVVEGAGNPWDFPIGLPGGNGRVVLFRLELQPTVLENMLPPFLVATLYIPQHDSELIPVAGEKGFIAALVASPNSGIGTDVFSNSWNMAVNEERSWFVSRSPVVPELNKMRINFWPQTQDIFGPETIYATIEIQMKVEVLSDIEIVQAMGGQTSF